MNESNKTHKFESFELIGVTKYGLGQKLTNILNRIFYSKLIQLY
jgi:hypothetical protein